MKFDRDSFHVLQHFLGSPAHLAMQAKKKGGPILVGATADGKVTVYVGRKISTAGAAVAKQFLDVAQDEYAKCQAVFAATPGAPVKVIVRRLSGATNGDGGAGHAACSFTTGGTLFLDTTETAPDPLAMMVALFWAELSECFMGAATGSAAGWNCGGSNGEGLSRFVAELASGGANGAMKDFATVPEWVKQGMPDWISKTEPTDRNPVSTGAALAYCYYMAHLGHSAADIAGAGGVTCQDNFTALGRQGSAYDELVAAIKALPAAPTTDNPF